jgi:hypothetical protein
MGFWQLTHSLIVDGKPARAAPTDPNKTQQFALVWKQLTFPEVHGGIAVTETANRPVLIPTLRLKTIKKEEDMEWRIVAMIRKQGNTTQPTYVHALLKGTVTGNLTLGQCPKGIPLYTGKFATNEEHSSLGTPIGELYFPSPGDDNTNWFRRLISEKMPKPAKALSGLRIWANIDLETSENYT